MNETAMNDLLDDVRATDVSRRSLLTYVVSAPVLTVAAGFGVNLATPSIAHALPLPLTPPDTVDYYDIGDSIVQTSLPTMPLVTLTVGTDGRVRLDLPRLDSGTGVATAVGMMVASAVVLLGIFRARRWF